MGCPSTLLWVLWHLHLQESFSKPPHHLLTSSLLCFPVCIWGKTSVFKCQLFPALPSRLLPRALQDSLAGPHFFPSWTLASSSARLQMGTWKAALRASESRAPCFWGCFSENTPFSVHICCLPHIPVPRLPYARGFSNQTVALPLFSWSEISLMRALQPCSSPLKFYTSQHLSPTTPIPFMLAAW